MQLVTIIEYGYFLHQCVSNTEGGIQHDQCDRSSKSKVNDFLC